VKSVCITFGPRPAGPLPAAVARRELQNVDSVIWVSTSRLTARGPNIRICRWQVGRTYHTWKTVLSDLNVCSSTSCTL
jgi:hypothetical protein